MKNKKMWLEVSFVCVILGIIILTIGRFLGGQPGFYIDGNGLHTTGDERDVMPVTASQELPEFDRIELDVDYADVEITLSDRFAVEYCLPGRYGEPVCEVRNGKFTFKEGSYIRNISFGFFMSTKSSSEIEPDYYVRVEVPRGAELSEASLDVETGDLDIRSLQAEDLKIVNEYGNVTLDRFVGKKFKLKQDSGDFTIDLLKADSMELKNEYGMIIIDKAEGSSLTAELGAGDCQVSALKVSDVEIKNEYGNVGLTVSEDVEEYSMALRTEYGYIRVGNEMIKDDDYDEVRYESKGTGKKRIEVSCDDGKIEIN